MDFLSFYITTAPAPGQALDQGSSLPSRERMYCVCSSVRHTPPTTAACTTPIAAPAATSSRWCRPSSTRLAAFVNVSSLSRYPEMMIEEH